jgi:hypothetical protein
MPYDTPHHVVSEEDQGATIPLKIEGKHVAI